MRVVTEHVRRRLSCVVAFLRWGLAGSDLLTASDSAGKPVHRSSKRPLRAFTDHEFGASFSDEVKGSASPWKGSIGTAGARTTSASAVDSRT